MRKQMRTAIVAVVVGLAWMPVLFAQSSKSTPDLSGVWLIQGGNRGGESTARPQMPLTPWAQEKFNYNVDPGSPDGTRGRVELDPRGSRCFPPSVNFLMSYGDPFQFVQVSPRQVLLVYEYDHWYRQIWIGEQHPEDLDPTWMGHSIGKWEGDTFVVDTVGMRDEPWFDTAGHVFSSDLHIVERFRKVKDTLEVEFTFEDAKAFSKPWSGKRTYESKPEWKLLERVYCDDRFKQGIYHGEGGF